MRVALLLGALLLAGCTGPSEPPAPRGTDDTGSPPPFVEETLLDQRFLARSGERGGVDVDVPAEPHLVWMEVTLDTGVSAEVVFHGLGSCDGFSPGGAGAAVESGSKQEMVCAGVEPGPQRLSWTATGVMEGRIAVKALVRGEA